MPPPLHPPPVTDFRVGYRSLPAPTTAHENHRWADPRERPLPCQVPIELSLPDQAWATVGGCASAHALAPGARAQLCGLKGAPVTALRSYRLPPGTLGRDPSPAATSLPAALRPVSGVAPPPATRACAQAPGARRKRCALELLRAHATSVPNPAAATSTSVGLAPATTSRPPPCCAQGEPLARRVDPPTRVSAGRPPQVAEGMQRRG